MLVNGGKMSKSLGNTYTITQLQERGYNPMAFRYFCLNAHYRKKLNFTFETLDSAKVSYNRLLTTLQAHKASAVKTSEEVLAKFTEDFKNAVTDDLNVPKALGILHTMTKEAKSVDIYNLAIKFDEVFGLELTSLPEKEKFDIPQEVQDLAEERLVARNAKEWAKSDELRAKIDALGFAVKDIAGGFEIDLK